MARMVRDENRTANVHNGNGIENTPMLPARMAVWHRAAADSLATAAHLPRPSRDRS